MAVNAIPDTYPRLTPYLCVDGAREAIAFYSEVFGATERMRMGPPDGPVGHAELQIGDGVIMISDEWPEAGVVGPKTLGGTPVSVNVYVEDVDATFTTAIAAGATELHPVEDKFWGDRTGQFLDPFGHKWSVATHIEDVPLEEIDRRAKQMFGA
ncbi:MAG: VOC family protein [Thermoleophilia bacterium]|nr:VOC family protein [Thermoleophilia bacterium]MDH3725609.1 VOC family protein [Thermoleophilia bacterium]